MNRFRRIKAWCLYEFFFIWCAASYGPARLEGQNGEFIVDSVVFYPVTSTGENPPSRLISFVDETSHDQIRHCKQSTCSGMRMGLYDYVIKLEPNGRILKGTAQLYAKKQWLSLPLGPSVGDAGDFEGKPLQGRVHGIVRGRPAWAKMEPLFSAGAMEVPIGDDGSFRFEHILTGKWLLLVLQGDQLLSNRMYTLPLASGDIEIDLK